MLIDTHCHLDYLKRDGFDVEKVIAYAVSAGVEKMITISTRLDRFETEILPLTENKEVFCTIGTHPCEVDLDKGNFAELEDYCKNAKVVGIGETGIDLYREDNPSLKNQLESLERHFYIAKKYDLPIIFHSRNAEDETIKAIKKAQDGNLKCIMHCFTGDKIFAKKCLDLGCYISFSGIVTFKNAESIREALKIIPLDRLLIETDSPFLSPAPHRGKINHPAFLKYIAEFVTEYLKINFIDLNQYLINNSNIIFKR